MRKFFAFYLQVVEKKGGNLFSLSLMNNFSYHVIQESYDDPKGPYSDDKQGECDKTKPSFYK